MIKLRSTDRMIAHEQVYLVTTLSGVALSAFANRANAEIFRDWIESTKDNPRCLIVEVPFYSSHSQLTFP